MSAAIRLLLASVALSGCYSFTTMGRARIVEPHHFEAWVAPEALIVATDSGAAIRPVGELGVRYGINQRVELDARLSTFGLALGPRVQLLRSVVPTAGFDLALAPALAYTFMDKLALELPLLLGINLPGRHQLVLGARLAYQARFSVGGLGRVVDFVYAGGSVGFAWQVASHLALFPEVAVLTQVYADPGFSSNVVNALGMQAGIGILYDH